MVKKSLLFLPLVFVLVSPLAAGGEISLDHEGTCGEFNVTLTVENFTSGIYDLKLEEAENRTLEIYDPSEGWKSSFFYLDSYVAVEGNGSETVEVKAKTNSTGNVTVYGKLRNGSKTWKSERHGIVQKCPEEEKTESEVPQPPDITLSFEGNCREYNVTLVAENFEKGRYDVKVGIISEGGGRSSGRVYDPKQGWKSSYYYVDEVLRTENGSESVTLKVQTDTAENVTMVGKLRKDGRTWKSGEYKISQDCPEPEQMTRPLFLLIVLIAVLVLLVGVTYYRKR